MHKRTDNTFLNELLLGLMKFSASFFFQLQNFTKCYLRLGQTVC